MKTRDGFVLREIGGNHVVVAVGDAVKIFNGMIQLNETGAFLWKQLSVGAELDELVEKTTQEFKVEKDVAEKDVVEFVESLKEARSEEHTSELQSRADTLFPYTTLFRSGGKDDARVQSGKRRC